MINVVTQTREHFGIAGPQAEACYAWLYAEATYILAALEDVEVFDLPPQQIPPPYLKAEDYPVLASVWDNDDDAIFDTM